MKGGFLYLKDFVMTNPMTPAIQEYMQRAGVSPQGTVSPQGRTPNPVDQPLPKSEVGTAGIPSAPKQEFQPSTQDDLIIMTLTEQLGRNDKLKKEQMKMGAPQPAPMAPTTPQTPPSPAGQPEAMGGGAAYSFQPGQGPGRAMGGGDPMTPYQSVSPRQQQGNYPF